MSLTAEQITSARLHADRRARLEWNEREMTKSLNTFASSIRDIHDKKLWFGDYDNFEDYCHKKWGITKQRAYQIISAESTRLMLADSEDAEVRVAAPALNDRQAAELAGMKKDDAEKVLKDGLAISKRTGKKMTSTIMKQAKARVIGTQPSLPMHEQAAASKPGERTMCPHCGQPMP